MHCLESRLLRTMHNSFIAIMSYAIRAYWYTANDQRCVPQQQHELVVLIVSSIGRHDFILCIESFLLTRHYDVCCELAKLSAYKYRMLCGNNKIKLTNIVFCLFLNSFNSINSKLNTQHVLFTRIPVAVARPNRMRDSQGD